MEKKKLRKILEDVRSGRKSVGKAMESLRSFPYDDIGFAKIDTHRSLRKGVPEVIFCQGKSHEHLKGIFTRLKTSPFLIATRAGRAEFETVRDTRRDIKYYGEARIIFAGKRMPGKTGKVIVASAGTADIPVAEEAAVTAELLGCRVERLYDVGVAGSHRIFSNHKKLLKADVVIVVAGMEGALASIVGGVVASPVIAVPTSVGYGASFKGITPLLTMLNSCSPGVAVVNIDNGFGAGYMAAAIIRKGRNHG